MISVIFIDRRIKIEPLLQAVKCWMDQTIRDMKIRDAINPRPSQLNSEHETYRKLALARYIQTLPSRLEIECSVKEFVIQTRKLPRAVELVKTIQFDDHKLIIKQTLKRSKKSIVMRRWRLRNDQK